MPVAVRPFHRSDRDQLTALVNAHVAAVLPGIAVSVNAVLSQLEREPLDVIVDPWVSERHCLVAVERDHVVAGALVHRFRSDADVGEWYRNAGDVRWLVCRPDRVPAGQELLGACVDLFDRWAVGTRHGGCDLPAMGCYGVSDAWPHLDGLFRAAGFAPAREEVLLAARCADLVSDAPHPYRLVRSMGILGARFQLGDGDEPVGYIEVGELDGGALRNSSAVTWTDIGNLFVLGEHRPVDVVPVLLSVAADWLRFGGIDRLVSYHADDVDFPGHLELMQDCGFRRIGATQVGWRLA